MEKRQFGTETSTNVVKDHTKSPKQLTRKQKLELWKQKQAKKRKPKAALKRTHQNAFGGPKPRSAAKRRRYVNSKKKERSASKIKSGSKKNSKKSKAVTTSNAKTPVEQKENSITKRQQGHKSKVTIPVAAPAATQKPTSISIASADTNAIMTPGKKPSNLANLKQRLSALKQSAKRVNPTIASRRQAEEELQKSLRKWKQDREKAVSSVKKSSATARRLREQQAARAKALKAAKAAKAAKAEAQKKTRYASKQRIAMLSRPKQVNKKKVARMRKAFNKDQISVKAKSAFIMFCSDIEEIKQMVKVNLREQACEQLSNIHKQAQFKVIQHKALFYVMRAAVYEELQMFEEAAVCFTEGKKHVKTEASTLEAAEAQFSDRLSAHRKAENEQVNDLLFSPLDEDIEEPEEVAKILTFDDSEEDVFEEIEAPVLHASTAAQLLEEEEETTEPQRASLLDLLGCGSPTEPELDSFEAADEASADDVVEAEVSPPPSGSTIMMGKVRANKHEQKHLDTDFFMSPVRRSARKMKVSPGSKMEKIMEEQSCSYKPNQALKGSLHLDESKPFSDLKATEQLKAAFQSEDLLVDEEESPVKMPKFPGIDMGLGSYLFSPQVGKGTPLRRSNRIANTPSSNKL